MSMLRPEHQRSGQYPVLTAIKDMDAKVDLTYYFQKHSEMRRFDLRNPEFLHLKEAVFDVLDLNPNDNYYNNLLRINQTAYKA